jgi:hypothetical protein
MGSGCEEVAREPVRRRWRVAVLVVLYLVLLGPIGTLVHEGGHAAGVVCGGAHVTRVGLGFGLVLYPELAWEGWRPYFGWVEWDGDLSPRAHGAMLLAGSGTTAAVALLASLLLAGIRQVGPVTHVLRALSLLHLDGLTYTFLPQWGLRHWGPLGGDTPEPLVGARALGLPETGFEAIMIALSLLCAALLAVHLRRYRASGDTPGPAEPTCVSPP